MKTSITQKYNQEIFFTRMVPDGINYEVIVTV